MQLFNTIGASGKAIVGKTKVLKDISFELEKGKALAIIGSSGSGKTTLLRCLNFLETPNSGLILVDDEVLWDTSTKKHNDKELRRKRLHFGMVFQNLICSHSILHLRMLHWQKN